jgi:hypothetical protein
MIRSVLAVVAGIITLTVTSFAIEAMADLLLRWIFPDALSNETAMNQNLPARLFMLAYSTLCIAAGGYVTAWVARRSEAHHALIMGVIQVALTAMAMIQFSDKAPLWFWIAGMALTAPAACGGGIIRAKLAKDSGLRRAPSR